MARQRVMAALLLAAATLCGVIRGDCVMTQTCVNPGNVPDYAACMPEANRHPQPPRPMRGDGWANVTGGGVCETDADCNHKGRCDGRRCVCRDDGMTAGAYCEEYAIQCPEYASSACCSWQQNQGLAENFKLLASVFGGNDAGGCDACAANLMHLWCGLVCSPRQSTFMRLHRPFPSTNFRPDPMTGEDHVKVLELDVTLGKPFTCALYETCRNTAIASVSEAMKSSLGFLNYQAQTGAIGHGEYIFLHFNGTSNATAFAHHVHQCSNYSEVADMRPSLPTQAQSLPSIASPAAPKQCPCASCRGACDAGGGGADHERIHVVDNPIGLLDGFDVRLVTIVYAVVIAVVLGLLWRKEDRD